MSLDPVQFAADLIRCPSVTPADAGALDVLQGALEAMGFTCTRYPFEEVDNLYARLGDSAPNFCFAGHTDVVPVGDAKAWSEDPFAGQIKDGELWGRGAADMKGGIAAFTAAVSAYLETRPAFGSISFLITGDEEGPAVNGTKKLLEAITADGEVIDHCLVGEPTNPDALTDMIKNGRRGSLNAKVSVIGRQGHVAYPHKAANPVPILLKFLNAITAKTLDTGYAGFQPSNLEVTSMDVGNPQHNVIPAEAHAQFNIRFNTKHRGQDLKDWLRTEAKQVEDGFDGHIDLDLKVTGEAFYTDPGPFTDLLQNAAEHVLGHKPALSVTGGTSDARFIKDYATVAEYGLVGATMHKVDERVAVSDIRTLSKVYQEILTRYFQAPPQ